MSRSQLKIKPNAYEVLNTSATPGVIFPGPALWHEDISSARAKEHTGRGRVEVKSIPCHVTLSRFCRLRTKLSNTGASVGMPAASNFHANGVLLRSSETNLNMPVFLSMCHSCEVVFRVLLFPLKHEQFGKNLRTLSTFVRF